MLLPFKKVMDNPESRPKLPRGTMEYLQVRFNSGFVMKSGHIERLKGFGMSDAAVAGFMLGLQYCDNVLEELENFHNNLEDE